MNIKLPLIAAAVAAVCTGPALAMPIGEPLVDQSLKHDVRLVCHANGRCYETHSRVMRYYDEPYYAPRPYGYYAPDYDYYGGPSLGFSFGFGGGHHRW
jgi:hypothetical protein